MPGEERVREDEGADGMTGGNGLLLPLRCQRGRLLLPLRCQTGTVLPVTPMPVVNGMTVETARGSAWMA